MPICFGQIANIMQRNQNQLILTGKYLPIQLFDIFENKKRRVFLRSVETPAETKNFLVPSQKFNHNNTMNGILVL